MQHRTVVYSLRIDATIGVLMQIEALENGDRHLALSIDERDILVRVVAHLRDHYDELEFAIRDFTREEAADMVQILNSLDVSQAFVWPREKVFSLLTIICETPQFLDDVDWYREDKALISTVDNLIQHTSKNLWP